MPTMNMIQALNDAHKIVMRADPDVVVFGEDAGYFGGVFRVTEGLQKEFGKTRSFDAPISEGGIVAAAVGMPAAATASSSGTLAAMVRWPSSKSSSDLPPT